jgi:GDP-4-dehydro-6-deoxy-D-mannose reductase
MEKGVCADISRQIALIESGGQEEILYVGNLTPIVDVLDIRDAIDGFMTICNRGKPGEVYNLSSGKGCSIQEVANLLLSLSNKKIEVRIDEKKLRPKDHTRLVGDNSRLRSLGWSQQIPLEITLKQILNFWRQRLQSERS